MATYLILNLIVLVLLGTGVIVLRARPNKYAFIALVVLLILTAVFDNAIIWAGVVAYDPTKYLNQFIGAVPIEDFFYPIAAALLVPVLWQRGKRK